MSDILFRPQCDDDEDDDEDDESDKWIKSGMRNMNRSLHISDLMLIKIDNGYEDEIDLTLVTLDYFRIHFLSYIFMI